jgi:hypothetical protein
MALFNFLLSLSNLGGIMYVDHLTNQDCFGFAYGHQHIGHFLNQQKVFRNGKKCD